MVDDNVIVICDCVAVLQGMKHCENNGLRITDVHDGDLKSVRSSSTLVRQFGQFGHVF